MSLSQSVRLGRFLMLVALWPATARGQDDDVNLGTPGLSVQAELGFGGTIDQNGPVPIAFRFRNDSPAILEGRVTLVDRFGNRRADLGEVILAPGTSRRLRSIRSLVEWGDCVAMFADGSNIHWRAVLDLWAGRPFADGITYALLVSRSERKLQLPGQANINRRGTSLSGPTGFFVTSAAAWQVPDHPGPIHPLAALILAPDTEPDDLNLVQWRAVAKWMCMGGVVFANADSPEVVERLLAQSPLPAGPPGTPRRVGLGSVETYTEPLFGSAGDESRRKLAERIAELPQSYIGDDIRRIRVRRGETRQADFHRLLICVFVIAYALLLGVGALVLVRSSKQRVRAYALVVVSVGVLAALALGARLRLSDGDLRWVSVTRVGAGGLIQFARVQVQSSGGRGDVAAVRGDNPDLQLTAQSDRRWRYRRGYVRDRSSRTVAGFTWQRNQSQAEDAYRVSVPITPWGERSLTATAFDADCRGVKVSVQAMPPEPSAPPRSCTLSVKLANRLSVRIDSCFLVVGVRVEAPMIVDAFTSLRIGAIEPGETYDETVRVNFAFLESGDEFSVANFPDVKMRGDAAVWILAELDGSPILSIDPQSDFVSYNERHLYIHEITSDELADLAAALDAQLEGSPGPK